MLKRTNLWPDFLEYYARASILNRRNAGLLPANMISGCPLQDQIPIYDTVWRKWAGFSKVLEDVWKGPTLDHAGKKKTTRSYQHVLGLEEFLYVCLVHRITGSGASFERDHGYRNSVIIPMLESGHTSLKQMAEFVLTAQPIFTSIGNQIPPFNKAEPPYSTGGKMYLHRDAPWLAKEMAEWLRFRQEVNEIQHDDAQNIKEITEWVLLWHKHRGMKQYKFVLTAFAMDLAEYLPLLVDQDSDVYLGKNAEATANLLYEKPKGMAKEKFHDAVVRDLIEATKDDPAGKNNPYSMEDVMCDFIRYAKNYIPKQYAAEGLNPKRLPLLYDKEPHS